MLREDEPASGQAGWRVPRAQQRPNAKELMSDIDTSADAGQQSMDEAQRIITVRQLLECGVHFGHRTERWNPRMKPYIFGARAGVHIIDLQQTAKLLRRAYAYVRSVAADGQPILFVGTKRQASDVLTSEAQRAGQFWVVTRGLGGTLTNWKTISASIKRLRHLDDVLSSGEANSYTKKERLTLQRERDKLDRSLGGIKDMGGLPDMIFVIDTNKEDIAIAEANRLNIPVAAIVDTNCDPKGISYVVPGNDDAGRAISLYCDLVARAVIDGISRAQGGAGVDIGAMANPTAEAIAPAKSEGFQGLAGPRGVADDLKKLSGVSGAIEKKLNDLGIFHYWQIAELNHDTAHQIGEEVGLPARADGWVAQSKALTAEAE